MKGHISLKILYCVNCNKNALPPDAFPHYCEDCLDYLRKYGRFPETTDQREQEELSLETTEEQQWSGAQSTAHT